MKLIFPNKNEFETDIILDLLKTENIPFSLKRNYYDNFDIQVNTSYEYFSFINKLAEEKIKPYIHVAKSYSLPCYDKQNPVHIACVGEIPVIPLAIIHKQLSDLGISCEVTVKKPKKSLLLRTIEWIKKHV